jgi:hypothetical protein
MNTHLSEASVNSLLSLVKGANTSGSYDDKINILTKAGVLQGGQKYSSRAVAPEGPAVVVTEAGGVPVETGVPGVQVQGTWGLGGTAATVRDWFTQLQRLNAIARRDKEANPNEWGIGRMGPGHWRLYMAGKQVPPEFLKRGAALAVSLDKAAGLTATGTWDGYAAAFQQAARNGFIRELRTLWAFTNSTNPDPTLLAELLLLFALFLDLFLITVAELIMEGPNYLSTIPDGNYSFTFYPQSGAGAGNLTGTAVINSQKEIYSGILVQKLINSKIAGTPPINVLQTLDASFSSRQIDTSGSSYNGKYTVVGNTATITSNGYSKEAGAFVETVTTITTYPAGFFVNNSIVNPDNNSYTPISLTIYTRQLTSAEKEKLTHQLIGLADIDGNKKLSIYEVKDPMIALISQGFNMVDRDGDGLVTAQELLPAIGVGEAVITSLVQAFKARQGPALAY